MLTFCSLLIFITLYGAVIASNPMSCTEISVNITSTGQFGNYSVTGNLKYFPAVNKTGIIQVSNVQSISYDTGSPAQIICQIPQNDCNSNISMAYNYTR